MERPVTSDKVLREILFSLLEICEQQERAIRRLEYSIAQPSEPKSVMAERGEREKKLGDIRIEQ